MDVLFFNVVSADDHFSTYAFFLRVCVSSHRRTVITVCADVRASDYGYDNGWLVTEGDNNYVDDGNDECFTLMMMIIITIVVLVLLPSVID